MINLKKMLFVGVAAAMTMLGSTAFAASAGETEVCPRSDLTGSSYPDQPESGGKLDTTREFNLSFAEMGNNCYYWGANDANDTAFQNQIIADFGAEYGRYDKTEEGNLSSGVLSGLNGFLDLNSYPISFAIDLTGLRNVIMVFKTGSNYDPAYAAFLLDSFDGVANGTFSMDPVNGLSHVTLYANVPLPASILMLIAALGGLALVGRRRETPAAA